MAPPAPSQVYPEPLRSFASDQVPAPVITIPVVEQGRAALEAINKVRSCLNATASCVRPNNVTPVGHWLRADWVIPLPPRLAQAHQ